MAQGLYYRVYNKRNLKYRSNNFYYFYGYSLYRPCSSMRTNKILGARVITNIFNNSVFLCPSCRPTNSIIAPKAHCTHCVCALCVCVCACTHARTHARMHTHTFNGPFSGTTQVSRYQKGKPNLDFTEARDSEWQWYQLGHMQVCISLQTDNHASTPHHWSFLQARCPCCRPTNSVKALKAVNSIYVTRRKPNMHRTAKRQRLSVSAVNVYLCLCLACSRFGAETFTLPGILRDKSVSCTAPHIPSVANSTDRSTTAGITTNREKPII